VKNVPVLTLAILLLAISAFADQSDGRTTTRACDGRVALRPKIPAGVVSDYAATPTGSWYYAVKGYVQLRNPGDTDVPGLIMMSIDYGSEYMYVPGDAHGNILSPTRKFVVPARKTVRVPFYHGRWLGGPATGLEIFLVNVVPDGPLECTQVSYTMSDDK